VIGGGDAVDSADGFDVLFGFCSLAGGLGDGGFGKVVGGMIRIERLELTCIFFCCDEIRSSNAGVDNFEDEIGITCFFIKKLLINLWIRILNRL